MSSLQDLQNLLGHHFTKLALLQDALTHSSSLSNPRSGKKQQKTSYERLEFLGDRVLGLVVADLLFTTFAKENEGDLARRHAALVRREALARIADKIDLGAYLIVSRGEEEGGGRANPTLLADACEAVIGALYADGGLEVAKAFIHRHWPDLMAEARTPPKDSKTALQEWAQGCAKPLPRYVVVGIEGPSHQPLFKIEVHVEGMEPVCAQASSKRAAEQNAAQAMLEKVCP